MALKRLAPGKEEHVAKIEVNLRIKFNDFDCLEPFSVADLDNTYNIILSMPWLRKHPSWVDWKASLVGMTVPSDQNIKGAAMSTVSSTIQIV